MSADLTAASLLMVELGAVIDEWPDDERGASALQYGQAGQEVVPIGRNKVPRIPRPHPKDFVCKAECGQEGHGFYDATTDLATIARWWTTYPNANIGGRLPAGVTVLDIDPRSGGLEWLDRVEADHGPIVTRTAWSGRGDGGRHLYLAHPGGRLRGKVVAGVDVKNRDGIVVLPPSIHKSGHPYRWDDITMPIMPMPPWLVDIVRPEPPVISRSTSGSSATPYLGDSIADWFTTTRTWTEVLTGWHVVDGDGEHDGSSWRHPNATATISATIRYGLLFVYSTNTDFEPTGDGVTHGYTRFRAFAVLEHRGDLSAAARAARDLRRVA